MFIIINAMAEVFYSFCTSSCMQLPHYLNTFTIPPDQLPVTFTTTIKDYQEYRNKEIIKTQAF